MKAFKRFLKISAIVLSICLGLSGTGICLVFYGPFSGIRELIVTTAMTTLNHKYIARIFLSDSEIQRIIEKNSIKEPVRNSNVDDILVMEPDVEAFAPAATPESPVPTPTPKPKEDISKIEIKELRGASFAGYLLTVYDPSRVRIASTDSLGKIGIKLKDMVSKYDAAGGINAGGFIDIDGVGFGGEPTGCIIQDYKVIFGNENQKYDIIGFNRRNILVLGSYTLAEARAMDIRDAIEFNPFLIVNGEPIIKEGNGGWGLGPRSAIGQTKDGKVLMLVIDGRQLHSVGATLKEVQDIMLENGAYNAANLDGGASTVMYYDGKLINKPSSMYGERFLPSAFIIDKYKDKKSASN